MYSTYIFKSNRKRQVVIKMNKFNMFITAVCVLCFDQTTMAEEQKYELVQSSSDIIPWSQRLSFILYWQIVRHEPLLLFFLSSVSAESREKKASCRDRWESHFHAISF